MSDQPQVTLDFERDWCDRHLEPFRAHWPAGASLALIGLFEAFVADPRTAAMCPHDAEGKADANALQPLVLECSPLCCYIGEDAMRDVYAKAAAAAGIEIEPPA